MRIIGCLQKVNMMLVMAAPGEIWNHRTCLVGCHLTHMVILEICNHHSCILCFCRDGNKNVMYKMSLVLFLRTNPRAEMCSEDFVDSSHIMDCYLTVNSCTCVISEQWGKCVLDSVLWGGKENTQISTWLENSDIIGKISLHRHLIVSPTSTHPWAYGKISSIPESGYTHKLSWVHCELQLCAQGCKWISFPMKTPTEWTLLT